MPTPVTKKNRTTSTRTCIGCRAAKPAAELVRLRVGPAGELVLDPGGSGRGASICADIACIEAAGRSKAFSRAFRTKLADPLFADTLSGWLCSQADSYSLSALRH